MELSIFLVKQTTVRGYDINKGHVIVAQTESIARQVAMDNASEWDEGKACWETAEVTRLGSYEGDTHYRHIILTDFLAG